MRHNADKLVHVSVMGQIASPSLPGLPAEPYRLDADGKPFLYPTHGSIVYNVSVGDSAYGWLADTIHPSVSIHLKEGPANQGLNILSCVGNTATVMTGAAKGVKGVVTGKSGRFSEHVIIHFSKADREKMAIGDKIVIRAAGVGLELAEFPTVKLKACSPQLLEKLVDGTDDQGRLRVKVAATAPSYLLGAGAGLASDGGSLHIQTVDKQALAEAGLDQLKLGDVVAMQDFDSRYSHGFFRGAVGIGVVGQGDSPRPGYGPGLTLLMTSHDGMIAPVQAAGANLAEMFDLRP
ncbi:MAG: DUF4438 domain-containing protein [Trueperaceae bacterium]|nr:MAG: DUF4438 domain-containing protein [Trueperaceae bacterium]